VIFSPEQDATLTHSAAFGQQQTPKGIGMWIICVIAVAFALIVDFISAPTYGLVFLAIVVLDLTAVVVLVRIVRLGKFSRIGITLLGLIAAFTLLDVGLRSMMGVRVLDAIL
jgi:hypothetical protein